MMRRVCRPAAAIRARPTSSTILKILGLDPNELDAVRKEGTPALPELRFAE